MLQTEAISFIWSCSKSKGGKTKEEFKTSPIDWNRKQNRGESSANW